MASTDRATKNTIQKNRLVATGEDPIKPETTPRNCNVDAQIHEIANITKDSANVYGLTFGFRSRMKDFR